MDRMFNNIQRNWKRIISVFMVLVLMITSVNMEWNVKEAKAAVPHTFGFDNQVGLPTGASVKLRKASGTLAWIEKLDFPNETVVWTSRTPDILEITPNGNDGATISIKSTASAELIQQNENVPVDATIKDSAGAIIETVQFMVNLGLSINQNITGAPGATIDTPIPPESNARALIMDTGKILPLGTSARDQSQLDKLNLLFGDATATGMTWESSNEGVIRYDPVKKQIEAVGVGKAELTVKSASGASDKITVYVRPRITLNDGTKIPAALGDTKPGTVSNMKDGDTLGVDVTFMGGENISDKLDWIIYRTVGADLELVNESKTNDTKADAYLEWDNKTNQYIVRAKAGTYSVAFFVKGTYTDFETYRSTRNESGWGCPPVTINADVLSKFETSKSITLNVNGYYDIAEALGISDKTFHQFFTVSEAVASGSAIKTTYNRDVDGDGNIEHLIEAMGLGSGTVTITARNGVTIPGVNVGDKMTITVHVIDEFSLNLGEITTYVGAPEFNLAAVFGSGSAPDNTTEENFQWTWDEKYVSATVAPNGQSLTVKPVAKTPKDVPTIIRLTWTASDGVSRVASCRVTISDTVDSFTITPNNVTLDVGGETKTLTTNLESNPSKNIQWISSNEQVVTVEPFDGNTKATISAPGQTGTAVITAINRDNGTFATCLVTVSAPITSITITEGTDYSTTLDKGVVQLHATYQPNNATNTDLVWDSSDKTIATVDEFGRVTLLKEGDTHITVRPKSGSAPDVFADCYLHIVKNPITQIITDVTELDMITGDTYEVGVTLVPETPSDRTLIWTSSDERIATVEDGVITAISAGEATISVKSTVSIEQPDGSQYIPEVVIRLHIRNRLQNIEFGQKVMYVPLGGTQEMTVIFTPDVNINDTLIWNSSDTSIVTVSDEGVLTGVALGSAMVTCYAEDMGPDHLISCMVYVTDQTIIPATGLTLLPEESTLEVGQTLQMDAVFEPEDTTNQFIQWSSSDENIATIDSDGLVTAVEVGESTITAIYTDTPDGNPWILYSKITVIPATVEATGFDITPDSMNIKVREHFTITPVFTPENTTDQSVEYQTTDESVATVSETGVVTGVGAGDCIIQCQSMSGGFIATCAVHVENAIGFRLSPSYKEIAVGKSFTISKVTTPANADKTAVWTSSNTKIATVSSSGKVTAKKIGTCTITCTLTEYNQRATCRVKVAKLSSKVSLNKKNIRIGVGKTYRLKASVWTNDTKTPALKWKSSNKKIATVSSKGKIKGKQVGAAKITVTTKDKVKAKATCRVTVIKRATSIKINKRYAICYVGRTMKLKATVKPKSATIKKIKWSSSNKNIAVVAGSGKVTGISEGDVTITAKTTDGSGKKVSCLVKVLEEVPVSSVVVAQTELTMKKGDSTKLTYSVLPNNNSDHITFASDNKRVATVNSKGKVKAKGTGTANITILAGSGVTTTVTVNVVDLNKSSVNMRQYDTETLQVFGTEDDVTWYSSNSRVATVDGGTITGRGIGSTYIYAYVNGCKLACRVTITSVNR